MVVGSGATDNFLDPEVTPGVRARVRDIEIISVPHTIVAAGKHILKGVDTGIIFDAVTDNCGNALHVSFRVVLVPGLGTNLFSVTSAMQKGVASLFYPENPRLESESENVVIPMESHGEDASGKLVCSIEVRLAGALGA